MNTADGSSLVGGQLRGLRPTQDTQPALPFHIERALDRLGVVAPRCKPVPAPNGPPWDGKGECPF